MTNRAQGVELFEVDVEKGFGPVPVAAVRALCPGTAGYLCGKIDLGDVLETVNGYHTQGWLPLACPHSDCVACSCLATLRHHRASVGYQVYLHHTCADQPGRNLGRSMVLIPLTNSLEGSGRDLTL